MGARAPPPMQSLEFLGEDLQPDEGTYLGPVGLDRLSAAAGGPEWHAYGGDGAVFCGHKRCGTRGGGRGFRQGRELMWGWRSTVPHADTHREAESPGGVSSARLEAFSDGVLSIAATLLVLELHVPDLSQDLGAALLAQWPSYAAYVVSFATIGIIWVNHHQLFVHVRRVDRTLLFLNLALLMVVSLIPFPTAILGRFVSAERDSNLAAAVYGGLMILMSLAFTALWRHVTGNPKLLGRHLDRRRARQESALFSAGLLAYVAGVGLAFISAQLSLLVYGLVALFYVFPWLPEAPPPEPAPQGGRQSGE